MHLQGMTPARQVYHRLSTNTFSKTADDITRTVEPTNTSSPLMKWSKIVSICIMKSFGWPEKTNYITLHLMNLVE
ncbi:Protein of unknown function [Pyronema omphalodes CBS 100304]|uniref:Uncharacterized protein n=1 Tax=Pyronema omphalodes (strain CBS 100304) TaxID=1076935 RepID=U4L1K2_PYROM|nr:Protein of unknown function [Pyronema omphalodes CBS 100304]